MAKCPLNHFKECYGSKCEWYIAKEGLCSVALTATNLKDVSSIRLVLEHLANLEEWKKSDK